MSKTFKRVYPKLVLVFAGVIGYNWYLQGEYLAVALVAGLTLAMFIDR